MFMPLPGCKRHTWGTAAAVPSDYSCRGGVPARAMQSIPSSNGGQHNTCRRPYLDRCSAAHAARSARCCALELELLAVGVAQGVQVRLHGLHKR